MRRISESHGLRNLLRASVAFAMACGIPSLAWAQVSLSGLEGVLLDNALIHLSLDEEACDAPEWRIQERFSRADQEIRSALEAFGYYSVTIVEQLELGETCWAASFDVEPGEPVRLRAVDVEIGGSAAGDPIFSRIVESAALEAGEPLQHAAYDQLKRRLVEAAQQRGYVEATFSAGAIDVFPTEGAADVTLHFESGPRYTFGDVQFSQDVLDRDLLDGYYAFQSGDPYDRSRLTELYAALTDSGYFNAIDVRPQPPDAERKEIPVLVTLAGVRRQAISYGLGFSTDTGPRFRFGRVNRRVNTRGAQSGINGQLSPVVSELGYNYRFPYGDPRSEWISFDAGLKREDTETATSDTLELGVRRVVARRSAWRETQFVDFMIEDFVVADTRDRTRLVTPGISWLKVSADNTMRPSRGYRLGLELSAANESLGSDTSFAQVDATVKWIRSFTSNTRLLLRARLGFTWHSDFDELPPSVRFFAGGDNSVRGYKFESLGPVDADGDVIGGDRLAVASAEYEFRVSANWSAAVFVDAGNAFEDSDFDTRTGAGFGLRWHSPVGPVRFDIAWPVDDDLEKDPRLHVSLGADL